MICAICHRRRLFEQAPFWSGIRQRACISSLRHEQYAKCPRAARKAITKQFDTLNLPLHSPLTLLPSTLVSITIVLERRVSMRLSLSLILELQLHK